MLLIFVSLIKLNYEKKRNLNYETPRRIMTVHLKVCVGNKEYSLNIHMHFHISQPACSWGHVIEFWQGLYRPILKTLSIIKIAFEKDCKEI